MNGIQPSFPQLFKGIALFTPGGDLIYGIDPSKQEHWHLHLCASLQEILGLPEPPHFLVPGYTGTIDRWLDPYTQKMRTSAELYPPIQQHQALLNAVFGVRKIGWTVSPWLEESCDPIILETYRDRFPQLWQDHDLIVRCDRTNQTQLMEPSALHHSTLDEHLKLMESLQTPLKSTPSPLERSSYVLRLFVSGHSSSTERILTELHEFLEQSLEHPYTLKVIDVLKHPEQAESNHISATPTLLRVWPKPVRRIIGDLNDLNNLLRVLIVPNLTGK